MATDAERLNKLTMELRRGVLVLAVLGALAKPHYGYSLRRYLAERGLDVDEGTLYPLLRRLETQGLLSSEWEIQEGRKRRVYCQSQDGSEACATMMQEWQSLNQAIENIMETAL